MTLKYKPGTKLLSISRESGDWCSKGKIITIKFNDRRPDKYAFEEQRYNGDWSTSYFESPDNFILATWKNRYS